MKKTSLLLVCLSFTTYLLAQTAFTSFEPIAKKPKISAFLSEANEEGTLSISYTFNGDLYWYVLNENGEMLEQKKIHLANSRTRPRGAIYSNSHFYHFYQDVENQQIKTIVASKEGVKDKLLTHDLLAKKEKIICRIANNQTFFLVVLNKKEAQLKVFRFNPQNQDFDKHIIPIEKFLVDKLVKNKFRAVTTEDIITPFQAATLLKAYVIDQNQLLLTIDGKSARGFGTTELLTLDLSNNTISNKVIGKSEMALEERTKSIVFKDYIYRVAITKAQLTVSIYALADLSLVKEYHYTNKDKITIMDSPFYTESAGNNGFYLFNPAKKVKDTDQIDTKKLLKKLAVGSPFIIPKPLGEDQIMLTVGTHIITNSGGGFIPGMPGSTINTPNGPVSLPGTPGTFVGGSSSYKQSRFFYSLLDSQAFSHFETDNAIDKTIHPVQKFVDKVLTNKHVYAVTPFKGKTAVIHYLRSDKQIKIDLFE